MGRAGRHQHRSVLMSHPPDQCRAAGAVPAAPAPYPARSIAASCPSARMRVSACHRHCRRLLRQCPVEHRGQNVRSARTPAAHSPGPSRVCRGLFPFHAASVPRWNWSGQPGPHQSAPLSAAPRRLTAVRYRGHTCRSERALPDRRAPMRKSCADQCSASFRRPAFRGLVRPGRTL